MWHGEYPWDKNTIFECVIHTYNKLVKGLDALFSVPVC